MTSDAISVVRFMWDIAFKLLTCIHIPGTNVTPLAMLFFLAVVVVSLKFLTNMFGIGSVDVAANVTARGVGAINRRIGDAKARNGARIDAHASSVARTLSSK